MTELWLAGAVLLYLLAVVRNSLLDGWWRAAVPAVLCGLWSAMIYPEIARLPLARIYAPLANLDVLVLVLMIPVAECIMGMRSAVRQADPAFAPAWWQRMLAMTPPLSLFAALRLLLAQAFQVAPSGVDFDTYGIALSATVALTLSLFPWALRLLLPDRLWRIELDLLLRAFLLLGIFAGYAVTTLEPTPPADASFSWKGTLLVFAGMLLIALCGASLGGMLRRMLHKLTRGYELR